MCRAVISLALLGYCQAARQLGLHSESSSMLLRWRQVYLRWRESPLTAAERDALVWLEEIFPSSGGH